MTAKAWYIKFPADPYALGPIRFGKAVGKRKVREWARDWAGVTRLVAGFQCWPTSD